MPIAEKVNTQDHLKTCPYCGKVPVIEHKVYQRKSERWSDEWCIYCSNNDCDVRPTTNTFYSKEIAMRVWNARHTDDDQ